MNRENERSEKREKTNWWGIKQIRAMIVSICMCVVVLVGVFVGIGVTMTKTTNEKIEDIGKVYMQGMGKQVLLRYETLIEQRVRMVTAFRDTISPDGDEDTVRQTLATNAKARGFVYLAFADHDGNLETIPIDGNVLNLTMFDEDSALFIHKTEECGTGETDGRVAVAKNADKSSERIVLFGVPTPQNMTYEMNNGQKSVALIVGMNTDDLIDMLVSDDEDGGHYFTTHIVRRADGVFVIRESSDSDGGLLHTGNDNYYEFLREDLGVEEKEYDEKRQEMEDCFANESVYSVPIRTKLGNQHLYCEMINHSDWYLISLMSYDNLEGSVQIKDMTKTWIVMIVVESLVVIFAILCVFVVYLRISSENLRKLQAAEKEAVKANKAKSEFLSNMSHDIRTPMNSIVGMTAIAMAHINNRKQVSDCLKKISLSSKHLLGLINDILDMSKIESGKMTLNMEQVSLREVMDGISTIVQPQVKLHRQFFDIYIKDIIAEDVYCDSVRLNQVLLNLLSNAIKFTPEEGRIEVSLYQEPSQLGEKFVRTHVHVRDNGIGMSEEFRKKIFESFAREDKARVQKTEGTGLGMAITKYIIDAMHGTIEVESEQGKGTHFHISFDLERAETETIDMLLPDWRMLVVDDDELLCRATAESLKEIGVRSEWVLDGESAIEKTIDAHDKGRDYNIILLDWKLPGIDGIETARRMRQSLGENIPILLISAYDWSDMEEEARGAGINGFISKPLFKSTLYYGLQKFTSEAGEEKEEDPHRVHSKEELRDVKILLAEDNDLNWEIAEDLLTEIGIKVVRAENGQVCVDLLKASAEGDYDAILMDLRMPIMTGYEAAEAIRALEHPNANIPIIAMTADAFADDVKKCLECGMNAHVSKPIDMEVLCTVLSKFIKKK